jgi:ABC-type Zn uptake system ZnuABC Zn-binding protein ZnuA
LVDYLKESKVPCIFVESSVNPKALQQIGREAKVVLGKALFSDALGAEDAFVFAADGKKHSLASWSGMMIYNIQSIVEGLVPSEQ